MPWGREKYLLWGLGGLFDDANETETGARVDVVLFVRQDEGFWSLDLQVHPMRLDPLVCCHLETSGAEAKCYNLHV